MSTITDGDFSRPSQDGARQVMLPLIQEQEYNCIDTTRQYIQFAKKFSPVMSRRTQFINLIADSNAFSAWTATNVTAVDISASDPEGNTLSASTLAPSSVNGAHSISKSITCPAGSVAFSIYIKPTVIDYVKIIIGSDVTATYQFSESTCSTKAGRISLSPDGWYCLTLSGTTADTNPSVAIALSEDGTNFSYTPTAGTSLALWGATFVVGSSVPPIIVTTAATRAVTVPVVDIDDALSFLVEESSPDTSMLESGIAKWSREYARVSKQTVVPSSIIVSRPSPNISATQGYAYGNFFVRSSDIESVYDVYSSVEVTADSGVPAFTISGGSYTLSINGATSATIAYNATAGGIRTALNAIPYISSRGGVTVTGDIASTHGAIVQFAATVCSAVTLGLGSLTSDGGTIHANIWPLVSSGNLSQSFIITADAIGGIGYHYSLTGGTYTITINGETTSSLAYDSSSAVIEAALNALPSIPAIGILRMKNTEYGPSGWVPGTGANIIFIAFDIILPTISGDAGNVTPSGASIAVDYDTDVSFINQTLVLSAGGAYRQIYAPSHGISNGDEIFLDESFLATPSTYYVSTFYTAVTRFEVINSNQINLNGTQLDYWMHAATISYVGRKAVSNYVDSPINARCKKITDYYLPKYTFGIESADDIPVPEAQNDGRAFFDALMFGGYINYVVGEIGVWKGPILYQTTVLVDAQRLAIIERPLVNVTVLGGGSVSSYPYGIVTSTYGSSSFARNSTIALTATPDSGKVFNGWTGDVVESAATISVVVDGSKNLTANFSAPPPAGDLTVVRSCTGYDSPMALTTLGSDYLYFECTTGNAPITITSIGLTSGITFSASTPITVTEHWYDSGGTLTSTVSGVVTINHTGAGSPFIINVTKRD